MQLDFDPSRVTYEELVERFFTFHDATQAPQTGWARSVIFVSGPEQEQTARAVMQRVQAESSGTIRTFILPADDFQLAGDSQQKHALQGNAALLEELRALYPDFSDLVSSTAATRVNAYLAGAGTDQQLQAEIDGLGLSAAGREELLAASPAAACPVERPGAL